MQEQQRRLSEIDWDYEFYELIMQIIHIICNRYGASFKDLNPRQQLKAGALLEINNGAPIKLWTPWGTIEFEHSNNSPRLGLIELLEMFKATLIHNPQKNSGGPIGPIYALHKVNGLPLPKPIGFDSFYQQDAQAAIKTWNKLSEIYYKRHSGC